ncbi:UDP-N-acetylglucosamine 2-epimerase [Christiangramia sediminis]|uniref:UDP-N-acetylglucosamine 2-epimerase n=1 Tax=Christiangramia sediminis TaxID=2881336 RepID=A0A9X1LHU3_9FLAO|nr:UDP-N-acetylglucosamine 2-epimerase [Christiangramia sediminis]MCB7480625.1 UDP-N-acetylglucosamine 2-epimerase [Christiangramia sediminis]
MKKVAVITGTRAEFGILTPLLKKINNQPELELQIVACAMHLSPEFGYTIKDIEASGFKVDKKIECLLSSDTAVGVSKSIGLALISFAEAFDEISPDLIIILGDRSEMLAAATAATIANIPIAHIHGGETTEGAYDESLRHAITKMSYLHFTSTEIYKRRVIQLGESPNRVFNVGAMGLDSVNELELMNKVEFEKSIDFKLGPINFLITYHPVTLESETAKDQFKTILNILNKIEGGKFIFTYANSDKDGRIINEMIEEFVSQNSERAVVYNSLGHLRYLSALKYVNCVLGNSSSGILEAPFFNIPTINIGDRQKGRIAAESVIHTKNDENSILQGIKLALSDDFRVKIKNQKQIYGDGNSSSKIIDILSKVEIKDLKKKFHDINF